MGMAQLSSRFQKTFVAFECISNIFALNAHVSMCFMGLLQLAFTWNALLTSFLKATLMFSQPLKIKQN